MGCKPRCHPRTLHLHSSRLPAFGEVRAGRHLNRSVYEGPECLGHKMQDNNPYKSPVATTNRKPDRVVLADETRPERLPVRILAVLIGLLMYSTGSDVLVDKGEWSLLLTLVHTAIAYGVGTMFLLAGLSGKPPWFMRK